jgi:hypothetical protein
VVSVLFPIAVGLFLLFLAYLAWKVTHRKAAPVVARGG